MTYTGANQARRRLLVAGLGGVVFVPLATLGAGVAYGSDLQPLGSDDPVAAALGYQDDASAVDAAHFPEYEPGRTCSNCAQYQSANDENTGGCALFPGKSVAAGGWCKVWAAGG